MRRSPGETREGRREHDKRGSGNGELSEGTLATVPEGMEAVQWNVQMNDSFGG